MKKFLTLSVVCAALFAAVGCEEKKSTGGTPVKVVTGTATGTGTATH